MDMLQIPVSFVSVTGHKFLLLIVSLVQYHIVSDYWIIAAKQQDDPLITRLLALPVHAWLVFKPQYFHNA